MAVDSLVVVRLSLTRKASLQEHRPLPCEPKNFCILLTKTGCKRENKENERGMKHWLISSYKGEWAVSVCGYEEQSSSGVRVEGQLLRKQTCLSFQMCKGVRGRSHKGKDHYGENQAETEEEKQCKLERIGFTGNRHLAFCGN